MRITPFMDVVLCGVAFASAVIFSVGVFPFCLSGTKGFIEVSDNDCEFFSLRFLIFSRVRFRFILCIVCLSRTNFIICAAVGFTNNPGPFLEFLTSLTGLRLGVDSTNGTFGLCPCSMLCLSVLGQNRHSQFSPTSVQVLI